MAVVWVDWTVEVMAVSTVDEMVESKADSTVAKDSRRVGRTVPARDKGMVQWKGLTAQRMVELTADETVDNSVLKKVVLMDNFQVDLSEMMV